ncbi:MAG: Ig-like domain-containing protein [Bacteroides oleiciplenus]|nr:Ig-like domain-containing protein [Bacteroides oleiciplenus]
MGLIKKYKCMNIGNCDNANKKTVFEIAAGEELKCPCCKMTMIVEVKKKPIGLYAGIAAAVIILGGGGAYLALSPGGEPATEIIETVQTDPVTPVDDSAEGKEVVEQEAEPSVVAVEAIVIKETEKDLQLAAGDEAQLTVELSPEGANDKLSWASSDDAVATVSESGLVTAVKAGKATVKVSTSEGAKSASVDVTVKKDAPARINLPYGYFEGPTNDGGKPNGFGIAYVTKSYSLDLKNRDKETLDLKPGDKIMNAKFKDGNLQQGELQRKDGTRKTIQIGG